MVIYIIMYSMTFYCILCYINLVTYSFNILERKNQGKKDIKPKKTE